MVGVLQLGFHAAGVTTILEQSVDSSGSRPADILARLSSDDEPVAMSPSSALWLCQRERSVMRILALRLKSLMSIACTANFIGGVPGEDVSLLKLV